MPKPRLTRRMQQCTRKRHSRRRRAIRRKRRLKASAIAVVTKRASCEALFYSVRRYHSGGRRNPFSTFDFKMGSGSFPLARVRNDARLIGMSGNTLTHEDASALQLKA